jgi:hypothetical protein
MIVPTAWVSDEVAMAKPSHVVVVFVLVSLLAGAVAFSEEGWSRFRGPTGLGYTSEKDLPLRWGGDGNENVLWKTPLVGEGHASPVMGSDRVFICTARWGPAVKEREKVQPEHHVLCYDAGNGALLWDTQVPPGPWLRNDFRSGPGGGYASPTPATDGAMVYCVFGSSVMAALDYRGAIVWRKELVPYTFDVTIGTSPILFRDTVIMLCAMAKPSDSKIVAYDKRDGAMRWERPLPGTGFGHSTPIIIDVNGAPQLLCLASGMSESPEALQSFDPTSGERRWWCWGAGDAASPAYGAGIVYFDSGRGGAAVAVDPTGVGDVTATHIRWKASMPSEGIGSPIIVDGLVYRLQDPCKLVCRDAADGRQVHAQNLEGVGSTWASPIADPRGRIFFATAGTSYVIQSGRPFTVVAVNDLGDASHPSPAVAHGRMYLAGRKHLYCVGAK